MNYKVEAWSWCADYCKKNQWNPHDSYFWNKALLEYRRQHNIFEVGDKVVFVSEKMDFLDDDQIHSISVITENNLPKVCGLYVSFEVIKHATDEEIKAGKRLEVKSEN